MLDGNEPGGAIYPDADTAGSGPVVYFGTSDIDASIAKARELGGSADDKLPIPGIGWFARCVDTEGNSFSLFQADESVPAPGER
jgi:predicted enzyme related to lactoylglutathione lyase